MRECKNCKELIGDELKICPFCKYEMPDEEYKILMESRKEDEIEVISTQEMIRLHERHFILRIVFEAVGFLILILSIVLGLATSLPNWLMYIGFVLFVAITIYTYAAGYASCPYCGHFFVRIRYQAWSIHCPACGKQIRSDS